MSKQSISPCFQWCPGIHLWFDTPTANFISEVVIKYWFSLPSTTAVEREHSAEWDGWRHTRAVPWIRIAQGYILFFFAGEGGKKVCYVNIIILMFVVMLILLCQGWSNTVLNFKVSVGIPGPLRCMKPYWLNHLLLLDVHKELTGSLSLSDYS